MGQDLQRSRRASAAPEPREPRERRRAVRAVLSAVAAIAATATLIALVALGAVLSAVLGASGVAHADNALTGSNPSDGASLAASPASLQFTFAEPLGPMNQIIVTCNGDPFAVGNATVGPDGLTLTAAVPTPMPKGTCNVVATVSGPDSAPNGTTSISFTITADTAPTTPTTPATTAPTDATGSGATATTVTGGTGVGSGTGSTGDAASDGGSRVGGPLALARLLATLGLATLLGSCVLILMAWPEGVEYILTVRFLRGAWIVALVGSVLTAALLTAQQTGRSVGSSLIPLHWTDLTDTTAGLAALARVALAIACGWVVLRPERVVDAATQVPAVALPAAAVATLGLERTGGDLAVVGIAAGILHALAMGVWFGGVALLARVVLAGPGEEDLVHAVRGFGRIGRPAIAVTILTGVVQAWRLDRGAWFTSSHGRVVLLKVLVVVAVTAITFATAQFAQMRLRGTREMTVPLASRLRRATSFEALGGIVVLLLSAWLLDLTPTNVDRPPRIDYAYNDGRFVSDGVDLTVRLTGGLGPNGVRVDVEQPDSGLTRLVLTFTPPVGTAADAVVLTIPTALTGRGAAVLPESQGVPLNVAGVWTLQVSVTSTAAGTVTAQKTFTVSD